MIKKLTKHGNSLALVIEKSILDLLDWKSDDEYEITTDGKRLSIRRLPRANELNIIGQSGLAKHFGKAKNRKT